MQSSRLESIIIIFEQIIESYPLFSRQHALFVAVCKFVMPDICIDDVTEAYRYGGMIGYGNSIRMNNVFGAIKLFRLHAAFHDAFGFMRAEYETGPGYCYSIGENHCLPSGFLLGHASGLAFWLFIYIFHHNDFNRLRV